MKVLHCIEAPEATNPVTLHHSPEDLNPQKYHHENLKSPIISLLKDNGTRKYTCHSKAQVYFELMYDADCHLLAAWTVYCTDYAAYTGSGRFHINTVSLLNWIKFTVVIVSHLTHSYSLL
jgi:hypothetical protein